MDPRSGILSRLFAVPEGPGPGSLMGRGLLLLLLLFMSLPLLFGDPSSDAIMNHFLHNVSLPIHEAGHVVFGLFGWFIGVLGGSLMQLLVPALFAAAFLLPGKDALGAAVCTWWLAHNFMDIAPYIADARAQQIMLLGGVTGRDVPGYHDWNTILAHLGWLQHDRLLATISYDVGRVLMVGALVWGVYLLVLQHTSVQKSR